MVLHSLSERLRARRVAGPLRPCGIRLRIGGLAHVHLPSTRWMPANVAEAISSGSLNFSARVRAGIRPSSVVVRDQVA